MAFVKKEQNGGKVDPNINTAGRPKKEINEGKRITRRAAKDKELIQLLRKLKPHQSKAIMETVKILEKDSATDANKIRAAAFLTEIYKKTLTELYEPGRDEDKEQEEEVEEVQPKTNQPVFSLKMINTEDSQE